MILTNEFILKWLDNQYPNILVYGPYNYITNCLNLKIYNKTSNYLRFESTYVFDSTSYKNKKELIDDIKSIIYSMNHYDIKHKKNIIILNIQLLNNIYQRSIKTLINNSYKTSIFMIHSMKIYSVDSLLRNQLICMNIPESSSIDNTNIICYNKIIKYIKTPITSQTINKIKELSYYYYMYHKDSVGFQRYIIKQIGQNNYLPNKIKIDIVKDITELNHHYQYSYRKPIFLEAIIMCLFKHLENYTTNL